jgi:hypothetical protein
MSRSQKQEAVEYKSWEDLPGIFEHWYPAWLTGYRAKAWPKRNQDCDDDRFNLNEKED